MLSGPGYEAGERRPPGMRRIPGRSLKLVAVADWRDASQLLRALGTGATFLPSGQLRPGDVYVC